MVKRSESPTAQNVLFFPCAKHNTRDRPTDRTAAARWLCTHREVRGLRGNQSSIILHGKRGGLCLDEPIPREHNGSDVMTEKKTAALKNSPSDTSLPRRKKACRPTYQNRSSTSLSLCFHFGCRSKMASLAPACSRWTPRNERIPSSIR